MKIRFAPITTPTSAPRFVSDSAPNATTTAEPLTTTVEPPTPTSKPPVIALLGHANQIQQIDYFKNLLATSSSFGVKIWQLEKLHTGADGKPVPDLKAVISRDTFIFFDELVPVAYKVHPSGNLIAVSYSDNYVVISDLEQIKHRNGAFIPDPGSNTPLRVRRNGFDLGNINVNVDSSVTINYSSRLPKELAYLYHQYQVEEILFNPSEQIIVTASSGGIITIWNYEEKNRFINSQGFITANVIARMELDERSFTAIELDSTGKQLATVSGNTVRIWNLESGIWNLESGIWKLLK